MLRIGVSLFCVVGIVVGIISLVAVWSFSVFQGPTPTMTTGYIETGIDVAEGLDITWTSSEMDTDQMRMGAIIVVIGLAAGFVSPVGGIPVIIGAFLFIESAPEHLFVGAIHGWIFERRIGPYIAILSGLVMLLSCLIPARLGNVAEGHHLLDRFITIRLVRPPQNDGVASDDDADTVKGMPSKRATRPRSRILALFVSAGLILAALAMAVHDYTSRESGEIELTVINDLDEYFNITFSLGDRETGMSLAPGTEVERVYFFEAGDYELRVELLSPWVDEVAKSFWLLPLEVQRFSIVVAPDILTIS
jgi:hypothetical protein